MYGFLPLIYFLSSFWQTLKKALPEIHATLPPLPFVYFIDSYFSIKIIKSVNNLGYFK